MIGSFATGFDRIPQPKVWTCPVHGRVRSNEMVLAGAAHCFWIHKGCGKCVEKL
jgi:hypothetical protein